jgi:type VI protein secretion system component VasK
MQPEQRDRNLGRMRRLRRGLAAFASALVLGFGALAVSATKNKQSTAAATTAGTTSSQTSSQTSSDDDTSSNLSSSGTAAPQSTDRAPAVTSGGS